MAATVTCILRSLLVLVVGAVALPQFADAQQPTDSASIFDNAVVRPPSPLDDWATATRLPPNGQTLDHPISRNDYQLGPGDVLSVSLFGDLSRMLTTTVTPEGTILIPSVGAVSLLGLNLNEAETRVADLIYRYYRNVEVELTLMQVRSFKVFLLGSVSEPGVRTATATTRVSEVVPITDLSGTVHRNIRLNRIDGDTVRVDLARFFQAGDLSQNPALLEGDAIVVPAVDETITLTGRVSYPGTYEYRSDDTLAEILWIANGGGPFPSNAADSIRVSRFTSPRERQVFTLSREEAVGAVGQNMAMMPFDAVYVPAVANYKEQKTVTVMGEVSHPGTYPVRPDTTTVAELVELAGGFTPDASLIDAVLRRQPVDTPLDSLRFLENVPPEFLSRDEQRIRLVTASGDEANVVVDFEGLFMAGEDSQNQTLRDGDVLYVPARRNEVIVLGAVAQPGILEYRPGASLTDYIGLAGGYTRKADQGDVVVLKAKLGTRLDPDDVEMIEPGDRIVVPFEEPRTFLERIQTVQGVVSTVSGLVVTVIGLERLWDTIGN